MSPFTSLSHKDTKTDEMFKRGASRCPATNYTWEGMQSMSVVSDLYTGRYHRAFLNGIVGPGNYTVRSVKLSELGTKSGFTQAMAYIDDPNLSLGYMSDTKLTLVWLHDYPGWLKFCAPFGIEISSSPKIAKRLTALTRLTYLSGFFDVGELKIASVSPDYYTSINEAEIRDAFGDDDALQQRFGPGMDVAGVQAMFLDGANVISRELLEVMITNGSNHVDARSGISNPWEKDLINRAIDRSGSFSLRVLTPDGQIKGDCFVMPRSYIPQGADVVYCTENIKTEVKTHDFVFALAEPHPSAKPHDLSGGKPAPSGVWSDDQTMSWLGHWLYPREQLEAALHDYARGIEGKLQRAEYPRFFTNTAKRHDEHATIASFQQQSLFWEAEGLGIKQSIFLRERIAQGAINKLTPSGKQKFPVKCAMYVHVATDSWLHMAGYYDQETGNHPWPGERAETPRGTVWYHPETSRLVYNDLDFAEVYTRHGGWDLDDSVRAHARTLPDGRKVWVIVRSPNSYGEYDIKNYIEGTYHPIWHKPDGETEEFPPIGEPDIPYIEELDIDYSSPDLTPNNPKDPTYTTDFVKKAAVMAVKFAGVFGRRANADMVYFATVGDYRRKQLAPIEAIVDACTQEQSFRAHELITADTEAVIEEMVDIVKARAAGSEEFPAIDARLWNDRIKGNPPRGVKLTPMEWHNLWETHTNLCDVYNRRLRAIAQDAVTAIDSDVIMLGEAYSKQGGEFVARYYSYRESMQRLEGEKHEYLSLLTHLRWGNIKDTILELQVQL